MNRLVFTSASILVLLVSSSALAAGLAPHRAYYDLEAKRLNTGNNISAVKGKLAYEITGSACDGYAVNYRIANRILYADGGSQVIDSQLTSWESGDGLQLDLTQKQFVDSKLNSESRIKVSKDTVSAPGKGEIRAAEVRPFATDAMAVFPTQYQIRIIDAAAKGASRDVSVLYEGSDDDKSVKAISFIGTLRKAGGLPDENRDLATMSAWPVTISYYPLEVGGDEQPSYQASFTMLENGVSTDLVLDFGAYSLAGKLTKLELLKAEPCK
jgi:hypothetical protein